VLAEHMTAFDLEALTNSKWHKENSTNKTD